MSPIGDIGEGYKIIFHDLKSNRNSVTVVISQHIRDSIVEVSNISDHLISIKIVSGSITISCYTPQTRCSVDEKNKFWEAFNMHLRAVSHEEHLLISGN